MLSYNIDIDNKDKRYLDEKELFILYWILRKKRISTLWSNVFKPNNTHQIHTPNSFADIANIEEDINTSIQDSIQKTQSKMQSPIILSYLLELGKTLDEKGFSIFCNADYSLIEGGFLCNYESEIMHEYLQDTEENRKVDKKYSNLNKNQQDFLEKAILNKDYNKIVFSKLAETPIQEYREAILEKQADDDFIELVNKLIIKEWDEGKWDEKDVESFLNIYYRHNKERVRKEGFTYETLFSKDSQQSLSDLIFENIDARLSIKDTKKLENYLNNYIKLFMNDELNGVSKAGLTGHFFSEGLTAVPFYSQFFGFKKQRDILVKFIEEKHNEYQRNDLEIGHPFFEPEYIGGAEKDTYKITPMENNKMKELFLFVHTMIELEKEGYLEIEDFSYGSTGVFDLYDRGFLFKIKLKYDNKNLDTKKEESEPKTYLAPSGFNPTLSIQGKSGYLQIYRKGKKYKIAGLNTRQFNLVKALFSPENTVEAIHTANFQANERVFDKISLDKDEKNGKLKDPATRKSEIFSIISWTIKELQKNKSVRDYIKFEWKSNNSQIRMTIIPLEGKQ